MGYVDCVKLANTLQGTIWSGKQQSLLSKQNVVIKITDRQLHSKSTAIVNGLYHITHEDIKSETDILKYLTSDEKCPTSIVKYVDFIQSDAHYYLVMENGGHSLLEFVQKAHPYITDGQIEIHEWHKAVKIILKQMIEAIEYIHSKNICHFDVSLENVLINDNIDVQYYSDRNGNQRLRFCCDNDQIQVKLCDFGLAQLGSNEGSFESDRYVGKPRYSSPELIQQKRYDASKNDVWCLGVCLFMLIIGGAPWNRACKKDKSFTRIMNGEIVSILKEWKKISYINDELLELFGLIFQFEENRADIDQIKQCKWLKD